MVLLFRYVLQSFLSNVKVETNRPAGGLGGPSGYGRFGGSEGVNGFTDLRIITINRQKGFVPLVHSH